MCLADGWPRQRVPVQLMVSLAAAIALVVSSACGSSPAPTAPGPVPSPAPSPTPPVPSFPGNLSGVWHGYLSVTTCYVGLPTSMCGSARTVQFVLRATPRGPAYVGVFELPDVSSLTNTVDVTGVAQPDGAVIFTGTRPPLPIISTTLEIRRLLVRLDAAAGLTGDIDLWSTGAGPYNDYRMSGTVLSASYQPFASLPGQSASGTWSGLAVIRECSGYCPSYQKVGTGVSIYSMALGQSGSTVSGTLGLSVFSCGGCSLPISGSVSGAQVSLSSALIRSSTSNDRTLHLESFDGTIDDLGRISGRFVYASDTHIFIDPFNVSYRIECEILWLKRD